MFGKADPLHLAQEIAEAAVSQWPGAISAIYLYGSAATGEHRSGTSDLNLLFFVNDDFGRDLAPLRKLMVKHREDLLSPRVITLSELKDSLDTFPLEFLDIHERGKLLRGNDLLADVTLDKKDVRYQLEREFKVKLFALRQQYLLLVGNEKEIGELIRSSMRSLGLLMRGMLWLDDPSAFGLPIEQVLEKVLIGRTSNNEAADERMARSEMEKITAVATGKERASLESLADYIHLVAALAKHLDRL